MFKETKIIYTIHITYKIITVLEAISDFKLHLILFNLFKLMMTKHKGKVFYRFIFACLFEDVLLSGVY